MRFLSNYGPERLFKSAKERLRRIWRCYVWSNRPACSRYVMMTVEDFLTGQIGREGFNRYDIVVRLMAIEEGEEGSGMKLYSKMQRRRGGVDTRDQFRKLIRSVLKMELDIDQPITLDRENRLTHGSHRASLALYLGDRYISTQILRGRKRIDYGLEWFSNSGFDSHEISRIEGRLKRLFMEKGMYFIAFVWPEVQSYFEGIGQEIHESFEVINYRRLSLSRGDFVELVKDIYLVDDVTDDRIENKLEKMLASLDEKGTDSCEVLAVRFFIKNPKFRVKAFHGHLISSEVEKIKKKIRKKYSTKIKSYFHDNIIHIGDNFRHTRFFEKVVLKDDSVTSRSIDGHVS